MRRLARFVFYALGGGVLVLFLIGYMARYVHPRYAWWAEMVAIGLPYLSLAAVGTALAAGALRAWRMLAAALVVLGLAVLRFAVPVPLQAEEERTGDLRIMTFNVPRWGGIPEKKKTERLGTLMHRTAPDLLALQEARLFFEDDGSLEAERTPPYVRALTEPPLGYRAASIQLGGNTTQPVLGQVPFYDLSQNARPVGSAEEELDYVVRTGFRWKGRRAVLYNVHLRSFGGEKPWHADDPPLFDLSFWVPYLRQYRSAYRARAQEVARVRAMIEEERLPVVVVGDFNSTPHSWAYRQLATGMQDAYRLTGSGWGSTYHARLPFARIDFVLASPEWEVVQARVLNTDVSDHRPLLATLRWRGDAGGAGHGG